MESKGRYIPNRLRKYRILAGYSQKDVAHILGMKSTSRISKWEQGTALPSLEYLFKLSILYRVLCDELYYNHRVAFCEELAELLKYKFKN
jgi:transcriptional regulator with XRE-family HTH domain